LGIDLCTSIVVPVVPGVLVLLEEHFRSGVPSLTVQGVVLAGPDLGGSAVTRRGRDNWPRSFPVLGGVR